MESEVLFERTAAFYVDKIEHNEDGTPTIYLKEYTMKNSDFTAEENAKLGKLFNGIIQSNHDGLPPAVKEVPLTKKQLQAIKKRIKIQQKQK
ncbi:MAG: hypothetical protein IKN53_05910 [Oscillibacter sp.]|nr:hypothetical protein [Oscillibacter sp.]